MANSLPSLTTAQLRHAADLKEKIEALNKELFSLLDDPASVSAEVTRRKSGMSAAGRARVAAAQKARWAKVRAAKPTPKAVTKRSKMGATARGRIAAAQKARWAKVKAEKTEA